MSTELELPGGGPGSVSLILAVRNGANYLSEAIESAREQSRRPDEIIVVDDGSTDITKAIACSFDNVVYLQQEADGVATARNLGARHASGEFICFLDHDDLLPFHSISLRLAALLARPEVSYVYGMVEQFFTPELSAEQRSRLPSQLPALTGRMLGACLFRRKVFSRIGGFLPTLRMGYMIEWVSRAQAAGVKVASIPDVVLKRRVHASNSVYDTQALNAYYLKALRMALRYKEAARSLDVN